MLKVLDALDLWVYTVPEKVGYPGMQGRRTVEDQRQNHQNSHFIEASRNWKPRVFQSAFSSVSSNPRRRDAAFGRLLS